MTAHALPAAHRSLRLGGMPPCALPPAAGPAAPSQAARIPERISRESIPRRAPDLASRLRELLRTELMSGSCSAEKAAGLLCLHRRTLDRRLKAEGTAFGVLVDESRFEIAKRLIADTDAPLAHIAAALDYSEASAFTRAFKRWSGQSPRSWRLGHRPRDQSGPGPTRPPRAT